MKITQKFTVFSTLFTALLTFVSGSSIFGHDSDLGLLNYMARSNDLLQQDPTRSLTCFNKYIPLINEIASNYETNFKACLNESEAASAKAAEATLEQRNELANAAEASCDLLKQCPDESSVEGIFQCYIHGGSASIQTMYTINANASQELAALREQYYLIKNEEFKCTNETKRVYEKDSSEAYAGLNNCILGISDIVTEVPSTTAEATTDAPTEVPTEAPTQAPSEAPTEAPSEAPTEAPTEAPSEAPSEAPTDAPSEASTEASSEAPTEASSEAPTEASTEASTEAPTEAPSEAPSEAPTEAPSEAPTEASSEAPSEAPTQASTEASTEAPPEVTTEAPQYTTIES